MGAHLAQPWVHGVADTPVPQRGQQTETRAETWPHESEGVTIPFPSADILFELKREDYQRVEGDPVGPVTRAWRQSAFEWAERLRVRFFGETQQVTGLWAKAKERFRKRLAVLQDEALVARVM